MIVAHEKCGFPVMLTVDLPEKYIGKEYFNVFTDLICQKEPMMILGIYIENPLEYNQLRSEGRINRFTRMQTNQLKIVTSHKKVLMNMGALSENEQNYLSYLKTLKDISYNDKILLDSIDLRHPFFPMFITNPPPWFILSEDTKILVLFFHWILIILSIYLLPCLQLIGNLRHLIFAEYRILAFLLPLLPLSVLLL